MIAPEDEVTRRLSLRLPAILEALEGDPKASKKQKNLPRGDYKEFVRLISVSFIVAI